MSAAEPDISGLLDTIEARAATATPGPWVHNVLGDVMSGDRVVIEYLSESCDENDSDFMLVAVNNVERLAKALRVVFAGTVDEVAEAIYATVVGDRPGLWLDGHERRIAEWTLEVVRLAVSGALMEQGDAQ